MGFVYPFFELLSGARLDTTIELVLRPALPRETSSKYLTWFWAKGLYLVAQPPAILRFCRQYAETSLPLHEV